MTEPPAIYDCIEFAAGFRCGDVATEVAFLAMDLRYRGAPALAAVFADEYAAAAGDPEIRRLLPALLRYRAIVRSKVAAIAAGEDELPAVDRANARRSALRHLQLAAASAVEAAGPLWLVLCGPPGSGKSTLAATLREAGGWPIVATDRVRKELAGLAATDRARPEHYTAEFSASTYAAVAQQSAAATRAGGPVVQLDGNFPSATLRAQAAAAAAAAGARAVIVHIAIEAALGRARVSARAADPQRISDAGPELHDALRQRFAAPRPDEGLPLLTIDGSRAPIDAATRVLTGLLAITGSSDQPFAVQPP